MATLPAFTKLRTHVRASLRRETARMPEKLLVAFVRAVKNTMAKQELREGLLNDQWPELPLAAWLADWPTSVPQRAVPPQAATVVAREGQPVAPEKKKVKKRGWWIVPWMCTYKRTGTSSSGSL